MLTKKAVPFVYGPEQIAVQEKLKKALLESPALRPINYRSPAPVILAVDTSYIAIGFFLCQCDEDNPCIRYYNHFESITLNDREARFSQAKLEIYSLYRALRKLALYLIGVRNLIVEMDARYVKGMLQNPDIAPSASINCWILSILTFHFELVHVPGTMHGPDGLSRRPRQPDDESEDEELEEEEFEDWIDNLYGFMHLINKPALLGMRCAMVAPNQISAYTVSGIAKSSNYAIVPCSESAKREDECVLLVIKFHNDLERPPDMSDVAYDSLIRYSLCFFMKDSKLWRRNAKGAHKLFVSEERRLDIMTECHDNIGHKGFFPTRALIMEWFWWPHIHEDVKWFICTCHFCQEHQLRQICIPPVMAYPAPLFSKIYIDTMHMPASNRFKYIIQGHCSLVHYLEYAPLQ
jgi:hypothetical protein